MRKVAFGVHHRYFLLRQPHKLDWLCQNCDREFEKVRSVEEGRNASSRSCYLGLGFDLSGQRLDVIPGHGQCDLARPGSKIPDRTKSSHQIRFF